MHRLTVAIAALLLPAAAQAAERGYSVTDFDRIIVDGGFSVTVATGGPASVQASGDQRAIDGIAVAVSNRTLRISRDKAAWGGWPGASAGRASLRVSTPRLVAGTVAGAGSLTVDRMAAGSIALSLAGPGMLAVDAVETDALAVTSVGSGAIRLAGHARTARISVRGSGAFDGDALTVEDLTLGNDGTGTVALSASRSATVAANGAGVTRVAGSAACLVNSTGSGEVACGNDHTP